MSSSPLRSSVVRGAQTSFLFLATAVAASAADRAATDPLVPADSVVTLRIDRPLRAVEHRLTQAAWKELQRSGELQRRIDSPEFDGLRQLRGLIETGTGLDWGTAVARLTAGGVTIALQPNPDDENRPHALAIVVADDAALLKKFVDFVRERGPGLDRANGANAPRIATQKHGDVDLYVVGKNAYAVVGRRLLIASRVAALQASVDLAAKHPAPAATTDAAPDRPAPLAKVVVDLATIRKQPKVAEALALPTGDVGRAFNLGGWVDLLARSGEVVAELVPAAETMDLSVRFDAGANGRAEGVAGYFAASPAAAAPLLAPPGTLYSLSFYRDFAALWDAREKLLMQESRERLETQNQKAGEQLAFTGVIATPADVLKTFGPHFRVVVARQRETGYAVEPVNRLPAGALVVDVRDAKGFDEKVVPLLRTASTLAGVNRAKMKPVESKHGDVELHGLRFADDEPARGTGDPNRFNVSPTWALGHGHFVLGSTQEIVRDALDRLAKEQASPAATDAPQPTERSAISVTDVAAAVADYRETILGGLMLNQGLVRAEAERELDALVAALSALGRLTSQSTLAPDRFEIRLRLGPHKE